MTHFTDLGVLPVLAAALEANSITVPTPIQAKAIPALLAGKNAYICSETGTGKTLAYLLPVLSTLEPGERTLQAIIVAPTHELVMQVCDLGRLLAQRSGLKVRIQGLIGGVSTKRQMERLKEKPHLIVGTSGRISELIQLKRLKPHTAKTVVVDEADRLLCGDSRAGIDKLIKSTRHGRQLICVSATRRPESTQAAAALAPDLVQILAGADRVNAAIEHFYMECQERDKPDLLRKLIHALQPTRAIVFLHRNTNAETLTEKLVYHKIAAVGLHGIQDNTARKKAIDDFRQARAKILIASDMAARGLDIRGVSHVINVNLPTQSKEYLHRVGRTSRAGSKGTAISLVTEQELRLIKRYQKELDIALHAAHLYRGAFKTNAAHSPASE